MKPHLTPCRIRGCGHPAYYGDLCIDCFEEIAALRQYQAARDSGPACLTDRACEWLFDVGTSNRVAYIVLVAFVLTVVFHLGRLYEGTLIR